jgi:hypothetical protein
MRRDTFPRKHGLTDLRDMPKFLTTIALDSGAPSSVVANDVAVKTRGWVTNNQEGTGSGPLSSNYFTSTGRRSFLTALLRFPGRRFPPVAGLLGVGVGGAQVVGGGLRRLVALPDVAAAASIWMVVASPATEPSSGVNHQRSGGDLSVGARISSNLSAPPAERISGAWWKAMNPRIVPEMLKEEN